MTPTKDKTGRDIFLQGAYNQVMPRNHFLSDHSTNSSPGLPLSARTDVLCFRTPPLPRPLEVTGAVTVTLYVSSTCVDTDFTVKLVDEYPPSIDFPRGFALNVTHGIQRCRFRNDREKEELMQPNAAYRLHIEMYPCSNLFKEVFVPFIIIICLLFFFVFFI